MSRKHIEETLGNTNLSADFGPVLKLIGDAASKIWQEKNGVFLNSEERKNNKEPIADIRTSDIQIRCGNQLFTVRPTDENKSMVSIPVGMSDKATPATIPREWFIGMFLDAIIIMCEGDPTIAIKYSESINSAINNAIQVDEEGRMKVEQKSLPQPRYAVEVAEMIESFKRTFRSKSSGSAKLHFDIEMVELEQVEETHEEVIEEPSKSPAELLLDHAQSLSNEISTTNMGGVVSEDNCITFTEPQTDSVDDTNGEDSPPDEPNVEIEEVAEVVANPTPQDVVNTINQILKEDNPFNFKKNPTEWIKYELDANYYDAKITIEDVSERAGCHVQTVKRALDKFQKEADAEDGWEQLSFSLDYIHQSNPNEPEKTLTISCVRSATGRFARNSKILFRIQPKIKDLEMDNDGIEATGDLVQLKATDNTDPSLKPCLDCKSLISQNDVPKDAPDFVCLECHYYRLESDEDWANETEYRATQQEIYDGIPTEDKVLDAWNEQKMEQLLEPTIVSEPEEPTSRAGRCVLCLKPSKFLENTAIGERHFCSENCWAEYTGEEVKEEGYYGLEEKFDSVEENTSERTENQIDVKKMMGY